MTAGVVCASCGTRLRDTAKFCDECGAPLAIDAAKYKQVTVLFADVVQSMNIAAAVDMERYREIMAELVDGLAAVVRRYSGTVEYTGDGVMALFGAPVALEDHALRGCLAALAMQEEAHRLAVEVQHRDGVTIRLRVGLNSGRVIAGEIGSGAMGYRAVGDQVGFAQRMESVAPLGGVMLSESTARLVEHAVMLAEPEWVHIKGIDHPVYARRLLGIGPQEGQIGRPETTLVGRRWEMAVLEAGLDRAIDGRGGVVHVVGAAGIGKSRTARETAALAAGGGVEVFWAFCESHARDIPFGAVAQLLRASTGVVHLEAQAARIRIREQLPDADPQDLLLLDDLLGIADPELPLPQIATDARRRRLTALINGAWLTRTEPALFIIDDAQWVDAVSESMLADFLTVIPRTPSMVLVTSRPEHDGPLTRVPGVQTIALEALANSDSAALIRELLGSDASVAELAAVIAEQAAGNPFFVEEMVRELAQRGVLVGERGRYACRTDVAEISVPATVQAAIAARIDRLGSTAKRTLDAASVIGARFSAELLTALGTDAAIDELLGAELIDQVRFTPSPEYAFRHPLIRAAAYESQLKSDRAQWHRRLAAAIEEHAPRLVEQNAALIAEHLEAAGDAAAYGWHMRAAAWSTNRDLLATRLSWERARRIADRLPGDTPEALAMRATPRALLCATDWRTRTVHETPARFAELQKLCTATGDKTALAIAMTGLTAERLYAGRTQEASRLASEHMSLVESIGDPNLTIGLSFVAFTTWFDAGRYDDILRWSQAVIDLAEDDPVKGAGFGVGSPLAAALAFRGSARWCLGQPRWREDLSDAVATARKGDSATLATIVAWTHGVEICLGVLRADDSAMCAMEEAVRNAQRASSDSELSVAEYTLGAVLLYRDSEVDRRRGLEIVTHARRRMQERIRFHVPVADLLIARETAKQGERDAPIAMMRKAVDELQQAGRPFFGVWGTALLVEELLRRRTNADIREAEEAIDQLANLPADQTSALVDITVLRLRALLARVRGDDVEYRESVSRYRALAESLGFEGHLDSAEAMA